MMHTVGLSESVPQLLDVPLTLVDQVEDDQLWVAEWGIEVGILITACTDASE